MFDDSLEYHADQQASEPLVTPTQRQHQAAGGAHIQAVLDLVVQEREALAACGYSRSRAGQTPTAETNPTSTDGGHTAELQSDV